MNPFPIYLDVQIGKKRAKPAPLKLMQYLVEAKVEQSDQAPCGFQLVFDSPLDGVKNEWVMQSEPLLEYFNRVCLLAWVGFKPTVLIDGFITQSEIDPKTGRMTVTGEDLSVKMDLFQLVQENKKLKDSVIVKNILAKYAVLGLKASVKGPQGEIAPTLSTPTGRYTDRVYLQRLAQKNDAVFYVQPGKLPGMNTAYWGPPVRKGPAQRAISARSGPLRGHIEEFNVSYDGLSQELTFGEKMADGGGGKEGKEAPYGVSKYKDVALAKVAPALAKFASLTTSPEKSRAKTASLSVKGKFQYQPGLAAGAASVTAQSQSDRSTGGGLTLSGTLNAAEYRSVLVAPGKVGVRAAGKSFSGEYYVKKVTHSFQLRRNELKYTQEFTLTREGLGAKKTVVK